MVEYKALMNYGTNELLIYALVDILHFFRHARGLSLVFLWPPLPLQWTACRGYRGAWLQSGGGRIENILQLFPLSYIVYESGLPGGRRHGHSSQMWQFKQIYCR
jgi:hypothetical protein